MMLISSMGSGIRGSTFALFYCAGSVILITPLAVWQTVGSGYRLTWTDALIVLISGLVYTALCFSLFSDGLRYVRVEHAGILGYLEPVTAPLWAFLLIGEAPPWTTYAGGALIVAAGAPRDRLRQGRGRDARGAADVSGGRAAPSVGPGDRTIGAAAAPVARAHARLPRGRSRQPRQRLHRRHGHLRRHAGDHAALPAHGLRGGGAGRGRAGHRQLARPARAWRAAARARHQHRALAQPHPVLPRHPLHGRGGRHLPQLPCAGVPGLRRAADPQGEDRARGVRRPRDRPGRHGADPRARPAPRGRQALGRRPALRLGGRGHVRGLPAVRQEPARAERAQHAGRVRAERVHRRRDARARPARRERRALPLHGGRSPDGGAARPRHHRLQLQPVHGRPALHPRAARRHHRLRRTGERPALCARPARPACRAVGRSPAGR